MAFPTPAQEASTSLPVSVAYQEPAPVAADFLPGDDVQLLRASEGEPLETSLGVVAAVGATTLTLGTHVYDSEDGWGFALVYRALTLPAVLSEIDAVLANGETVRLMGRGDTWMDANGVAVQSDGIRSFETAI